MNKPKTAKVDWSKYHQLDILLSPLFRYSRYQQTSGKGGCRQDPGACPAVRPRPLRP
ncbi:hypothetical protein CBFG_04041 [Clostridiales bacterium 1_7_47FAA]|nr:hypothetical protein CBFG_04041 [Clostridiales bacterium 1_7_47FAA]